MVQRRDPLPAIDVVGAEAALELPIRPGEMALLGGVDHRHRPGQAIGRRRLLVGTELAQQYLPVMRLGPGRDAVELAVELGPVGCAAPAHAGVVADVRRGPRRALVGEAERVVVVHGDQQVRIVLGQAQAVERGEGIAAGRAHHHRAGRIVAADDLQRIAQQIVPHRAGHLAVGLVEDLEQHRRRRVAVARGDLVPERQQPGPAQRGIGGAGVEVVFVQDHVQARGGGLVDHRIQRLQPGRVEPVVRVHVRERLQVDPHRAEAAVADRAVQRRAETRLRRVVPQRVVAEDVDPAPEPGEGVVGLRARRRQRQAQQGQEQWDGTHGGLAGQGSGETRGHRRRHPGRDHRAARPGKSERGLTADRVTSATASGAAETAFANPQSRLPNPGRQPNHRYSAPPT
ncbi:hypothetical protein NB706_003608 [Xanthomonas sacchari]|nr:hypothetical protein [Xanthomonas sacchari]